MSDRKTAVDLICCGLDDGTVILDTPEDAHAFRESYTTGPGTHPTERSSGHVRQAIIRAAKPGEKRRNSTFLIAVAEDELGAGSV